jgi:Domain of unknown function (DUF4062)/Patatin-like phospholipase
VRLLLTQRGTSRPADVVVSVLRKLEVIAVDHRDSGATGQPSVQWCMDKVDGCDIVVVLLAHRYGWVPSITEGGDGKTCITWLEARRTRAKGKVVLPYLLGEDASWNISFIEGLFNPSLLPLLSEFRRELSSTIAGFFTAEPWSLDGPVSRDVQRAINELFSTRLPNSEEERETQRAGIAPMPTVPWIYTRDRPPTVAERMMPDLPKRILCLDGIYFDAGIALSYLVRIERLLQVRYSESDLKLSDYFDLIVGSGFGAVVAVELGLGRDLNEVREFFDDVAAAVFSKRTRYLKRLQSIYDLQPLASVLDARYGETTIRSSAFKTASPLSRLDSNGACPGTSAIIRIP